MRTLLETKISEAVGIFFPKTQGSPWESGFSLLIEGGKNSSAFHLSEQGEHFLLGPKCGTQFNLCI